MEKTLQIINLYLMASEEVQTQVQEIIEVLKSEPRFEVQTISNNELYDMYINASKDTKNRVDRLLGLIEQPSEHPAMLAYMQ